MSVYQYIGIVCLLASIWTVIFCVCGIVGGTRAVRRNDVNSIGPAFTFGFLCFATSLTLIGLGLYNMDVITN